MRRSATRIHTPGIVAALLATLLTLAPPARAAHEDGTALRPPEPAGHAKAAGDGARDKHRRHHAARAGAHAPAHHAASGPQQAGRATWYGGGGDRVGKRTASGERFDPNRLTAAHPSLPMHTRVMVTNLRNHRVVTVTVNDRCKRRGNRIIDLSPRAAEALGMKRSGVAPVVVVALPTTAEAAP